MHTEMLRKHKQWRVDVDLNVSQKLKSYISEIGHSIASTKFSAAPY